MTDYDHWPPIRFRFFGDEEQAKGRIPQARSLMAQLIRRMEGFERDNGQWQVQAEDGTQFRVMKMGDVHVADIFGVSPQVKRPRPMRDITPAPEVAQREILMRPHGEAFGEGTGDYLWIGAEVDYSFFTEDFYAPLWKTFGTKATINYIQDRSDPAKYIPQKISEDEEKLREFYGDVAELPTVNLMLFEPGWDSENSTATVMQSAAIMTDSSYSLLGGADFNKPTSPLLCTEYSSSYTTLRHESRESYSIKLQLAGLNEGFYFWPNFACQSLTTPEPGEIPQFLCEKLEKDDNFQLNFVQRFWQSQSGAFTAYPYADVGGYGKRVDTFIKIDPRNTTQRLVGCVDSCYAGIEGYINTDGYTGNGVYVVNTSSWVNQSTTSFSNPWDSKNRTYKFVFTEYVPGENGDSVNFTTKSVDSIENYFISAQEAGLDFSHEIQASNPDGVYELRLALDASSTAFNSGSPVICKVHIQVDREQPPETYEIEVPALDDYRFAFDTAGWMTNKTPTPITNNWYPGCWLIDVKNKTIIHETNPANLTRDWFTTE